MLAKKPVKSWPIFHGMRLFPLYSRRVRLQRIAYNRACIRYFQNPAGEGGIKVIKYKPMFTIEIEV